MLRFQEKKMNIKDQVASLELCQRLKELGVKNHTLFFWGESLTGRHAETEFNVYASWLPASNILREYPAFTVAELLEILPVIVNSSCLQLLRGLNFGDIKPMYCCRYDLFFSDNSPFGDENPANACAKMLIHLIEQGIYKS